VISYEVYLFCCRTWRLWIMMHVVYFKITRDLRC
jgi:hypothetical protein